MWVLHLDKVLGMELGMVWGMELDKVLGAELGMVWGMELVSQLDNQSAIHPSHCSSCFPSCHELFLLYPCEMLTRTSAGEWQGRQKETWMTER